MCAKIRQRCKEMLTASMFLVIFIWQGCREEMGQIGVKGKESSCNALI